MRRRLAGTEDIPARRCGHLACGTHCTLTSVAAERNQQLQARALGRERRLQQLTRKEAKLRDLQGRELGCMSARYGVTKAPYNPPCEGRCGTEYGGFATPVHVDVAAHNTRPSTCDTHPLLTPEELSVKLKENPKFLMEQMCLHLKKYDRYNRGIVSAAVFSKLLRCLGAYPPLPEINEVLYHCILTRDGFVVYKPLIIATTPNRVPGYKDQVRDHLSPPEVWKKDIYRPACPKSSYQHPFRSEIHRDAATLQTDEVIEQLKQQREALADVDEGIKITAVPGVKVVDWSAEKTPPWKFELHRDPLSCPQFTPRKSDAVRRLFAMWDRCLIDDEKFKQHITFLGIPITRETEWLLSLHSGSRSLSFGKFLQALQIEDLSSLRKNRGVTPFLASHTEQPPPSRFSGRRLFESKTDPLTWRCRPSLSIADPSLSKGCEDSIERGYHRMRWTSDRHRVPEGEVSGVACCNTDVDAETLRHRQIRQLVVDTEAGRVLPTVVRGMLDRWGVTITPELDRLLQQQETEGGVSYTKLMMAISRAAGWRTAKSCEPCSSLMKNTDYPIQSKQLRFRLPGEA